MELMEQIEQVIARRVRPALAAHGGDITVVGLEEGVLRVKLLGQCSSCMSAADTVQDVVAAEIMGAVPQVQRVDLITGVSEDLLAQARAMLSGGRRS